MPPSNAPGRLPKPPITAATKPNTPKVNPISAEVNCAGVIIAPLAGRLSDRYQPGFLGRIGLAILCTGMALLATLPAATSIADIVWRMAICGAGFGFFQAPNARAIMSGAPVARSGSASGIASLVRLLGQTIGAALVAACFAFSKAHGPALAAALGSAFAGVASIASILRIRARPSATHTEV
jgi:DHA2 family multidrug resistance protein-like MFS transporter